ncbi:glycosyltransferase family 2 protein [Vibrio sp. WXL103]|uniref:glycosyltransferase family 2 protein n=1 Tax=Vibrio sp. WXL103 TaxID=3450710 RepID=UPI003EC947FE
MNHKGTILIVLYNKTLLESSTLSSLMDYQGNLSHIDLLIWNNGPSEIDTSLPEIYSEKFHSITVHQDTSNVALSKIYNFALEHNNNDFCIVLDDDSTLSQQYLDEATKGTREACLVPILTNKGKVQSPTIKKSKVEQPQQLTEVKRFRAVGSGVVIGRQFKEMMKKAHGSVFDERFVLYGVDTTFFMRAEQIKLIHLMRVIPGFEHSYSRLESEDEQLSEFRKKERAYDEGLRNRYYKSKPSLLLYTLKLLKKIASKDDNQNELFIWDAIKSGKHYRS